MSCSRVNVYCTFFCHCNGSLIDPPAFEELNELYKLVFSSIAKKSGYIDQSKLQLMSHLDTDPMDIPQWHESIARVVGLAVQHSKAKCGLTLRIERAWENNVFIASVQMNIQNS